MIQYPEVKAGARSTTQQLVNKKPPKLLQGGAIARDQRSRCVISSWIPWCEVHSVSCPSKRMGSPINTGANDNETLQETLL